jgi:hypothetical protein
MTSVLEPGVHRLRAVRPSPPPRVRCDIPAFVGISRQGPIGVPVAVESWREFEACFGSLDAPGYLPFAVRGFFENGGRRCHVVRVADIAPGGARAASLPVLDVAGNPAAQLAAASPGSWGNELDVRLTELRRGRTALRHDDSDIGRLAVGSVVGYAPGSLIEIRPSSASPAPLRVVATVDATRRLLELDRVLTPAELLGAVDLERISYRVDVRRRGRLLAGYDGLSPVPWSPRYASTVLDGDIAAAAEMGLPIPLVAWIDARDPLDVPVRLQSTTWMPMTAGADGLTNLSADDFIGEPTEPDDDDLTRRVKTRGLAAVADIAEVALVAVPDAYNPVPPAVLQAPPRCPEDPCRTPDIAFAPRRDDGERPRQLTSTESLRVQQSLVEQCATLRDRVAILDPPPRISDPLVGDEELEYWRAQVADGYAAAYTPWLEVADPRPGALQPTLAIPPCGHVLGAIATNDALRGVHHAPANTRLEWVSGWTVDYGPEQHARHNDNGINVLRAPLDGGLRILGARTLTDEPVWKFLNVRRLLIFLERSLLQMLAWCVHEPNNDETRSKVRLCVSALLLELHQRGAFAGATPAESFEVRCDNSNNPPKSRANGLLLAEVSVAPTIPMEFIVLRIGRVENSLNVETDESLGGGVWPR